LARQNGAHISKIDTAKALLRYYITDSLDRAAQGFAGFAQHIRVRRGGGRVSAPGPSE